VVAVENPEWKLLGPPPILEFWNDPNLDSPFVSVGTGSSSGSFVTLTSCSLPSADH
jgi:hypothetical protein